jgi:hypothetical protein
MIVRIPMSQIREHVFRLDVVKKGGRFIMRNRDPRRSAHQVEEANQRTDTFKSVILEWLH